ncbi:MAG: ATP-dependent Clp protease adaptor ClpS [Phycisphaerales bacterium]|nr:MAG: ATP-dependent Clp protease adaptor ClpS [Phycisphaerales bacterium]
MSTTAQTLTAPGKVAPAKENRPKRLPPYHVILLDDDDHTYDYVIGMVRKLFGYTPEHALQLAAEVDQAGRVILDTTTFERAELKRDQIHAFGRDWRIPRCQGSMSADIEPAED